jgi:hypothetical protein
LELTVAIEVVVEIEGDMKPEDRERFLKGFTNTFYNSKLDFTPPYQFSIRLLTDEERKALEGSTSPSS